jgi:hypothetical protein
VSLTGIDDALAQTVYARHTYEAWEIRFGERFVDILREKPGGGRTVDLSNWTLTHHQTQQAIFSSVKIPSGTRLAARGFYLLGLSNSGLAVPAKVGDKTIYVRSTTGMDVGDAITIDTGAGVPRKYRTGLTHAKRSRTWRKATFRLRMPPPTGVVSGPLMPTRYSWKASIVSSGSQLSNLFFAVSPA